MRKRLTGALLAALATSCMSCQRVEEPSPPRSVASTGRGFPAARDPSGQNLPAKAKNDGAFDEARQSAKSAADGTKADATAERCLVSTPEEAPAPARPAAECPADDGQALAFPPGSVRFPESADTRLVVELASDPAQRTRGLMFRTHMAENHGMLFSWPDDQVQTFWMHNTCIPLDMLFIARDGLIAGILEQIPTLNDRGRSIPCPVAYVLEVNAGWTRKHHVRAGQKVQIN
jgi:uncharacterized membrane protein (UPF0127 family)